MLNVTSTNRKVLRAGISRSFCHHIGSSQTARKRNNNSARNIIRQEQERDCGLPKRVPERKKKQKRKLNGRRWKEKERGRRRNGVRLVQKPLARKGSLKRAYSRHRRQWKGRSVLGRWAWEAIK